MSSQGDLERIKAFEARLEAARNSSLEREGPTHRGHTDSGAAWRMIIELVTGIGVGFGMGYGLDALFGTMPVFIVIFTLLGFGAGVRVVVQTAQQLQLGGTQTAGFGAGDDTGSAHEKEERHGQ